MSLGLNEGQVAKRQEKDVFGDQRKPQVKGHVTLEGVSRDWGLLSSRTPLVLSVSVDILSFRTFSREGPATFRST